MRPRALAAFLLASALAASPALAEGVRAVAAGETVEGLVEEGLLEAVPFDAAEGALLDVSLGMAPGAGPSVAVLQPDRTLLPDLALYGKVDRKDAALKVKKAPLLQSGRHWILVQPAVAGAYRLRFKCKAPPKREFSGYLLPDPPAAVAFGGVPGALATISVKRARLSVLSPWVLSVEGPGGGALDLAAAASRKTTPASDQVRSLPLLESGRHVVRVGTQPATSGDYGIVRVSVRLPKPSKESRSDADIVVDPFVDGVVPASGFDNLPYAGLEAAGEFFRPGASVRIEGLSGSRSASGVTYSSSRSLLFDLDLSGLPAGGYDLVVTLADGGEGRRAGAFTVRPTPVPSGVSPSPAFDNRTQVLAVAGSRFQEGAAVAVTPSGGGPGVAGTVLSWTESSITASFPLLDAPLGDWDVTVVNPDGGTNTLPAGMEVRRGPRVSSASPLLGHDNDAARAVALAGAWFQPGMTCLLDLAGQAPVAGTVSGLTAGSVTATFDLRGKAAGAWAIRVANPDGGTIDAPSPFAVARAPRLQSLSPPRGFEGETASGCYAAGTDLVPGASAVLERGGSATVAASNEAVGGGGTTIAFDLPLAAAAPGLHDLRVTNPDGGSEALPDAFRVLGTRTLESSAASAGPPSLAFDPDRGVYLAVWAAHDGSQWDVYARRYDAATGEPLGSTVAVTSVVDDGSTSLDQVSPSAVFVPQIQFGDGGTFSGWLVAYAWKDVNAAGNRTGVRMQLLEADGTVHTPQSQAYPVASYSSGTAGPPRAAWNPARTEGLVVWAWDVDGAPDVAYGMIGGWTDVGGVLIPFGTTAGTLIANTHSTVIDGQTVAVPDRDFEPDVAYGATSAEWVVTYTFDLVETGNPPPLDGRCDVRAAFFDDDFSAGPALRAHLTTLGNVASKDDRRGRVAWDPGSNRFLAAWDHEASAGDRDVRVWLLEASTRARVGASFTTADTVGTADAASPAIAFDATSGSPSWLVVYSRTPNTPGSSAILRSRLPVDGASLTGLGTPSSAALAAAVSGTLFGGPAVVARGSGGEFLAAWTASGSGKAPVDAEARFAR